MSKTKTEIKIYHSDFETTTQPPVSVWLWGIKHDNEKFVGKTIEGFLKKCASIVAESPAHIKNEFHFVNLEFDATFIMHHLLKNGYKHFDTTKPRALPNTKQFKLTMLSKQVYNLSINYNGILLIFRDSLKYINGSVKKWGDVLGIPKGETPLYKTTPEEITKSDIEYLIRDLEIPEKVQHYLHLKGLTKNTTASNAINYWKSINALEWKEWLCDGKKDYRELTSAYRGGRTLTNPKYFNVEQYNLNGYDVISMYPGEMYDNWFPTGYADEINGKVWKRNKSKYLADDVCSVMYFSRLKVSAKNPDFLFVAVDGKYKKDYDCPCMMSSVDYKILQQDYNIEIEECELIYFWDNSKCNRDLFKSYIDYWIEIKNTTTGVERELAKLMLNALYGKFGTKTEQVYYFPYLDNDIVKYKLVPHVSAGVYMPIAIFVTAYARKKLHDTILMIGIENWVYCDTDSIYSKEKLPAEICGNTLGKWKLETVIEKGLFTVPKRYKYKTFEGKTNVRFASLQSTSFHNLEYEDIKLTNHVWNKKHMTNVAGGKAMIDRILTV